jgi:hypothetical protein
MMVRIDERNQSRRLELLKDLINDEDYIAAAVSRIAKVLSDELTDSRPPGELYERKR